MPIYDVKCPKCHIEEERIIPFVPDRFIHVNCGTEMELVFRPPHRKGPQELPDNATVVIFRNPETGQVRYPGRRDAQVPTGFERVMLKTTAQVRNFERAEHVRVEVFNTERTDTWVDDSGRRHRA